MKKRKHNIIKHVWKNKIPSSWYKDEQEIKSWLASFGLKTYPRDFKYSSNCNKDK